MIQINGASGEGGGQVLRSSLSLSLVTGMPFQISNIRANRKKPGLMRQHLTAVNAAAKIGCAHVKGAEIGSRTVIFSPGTVTPGTYRFSVGTAGSCTLVFQAVLPALLAASGPSEIMLEGGTHNPLAPPFDFLEKAFLPLIRRMGAEVSVTLERHGFYPAGGGRFCARIEPAVRLKSLRIPERGAFRRRKALAVVCGLPGKIGERETAVIRNRLSWPEACCKVERSTGAVSAGNYVTIEISSEHVTEIFTGFGQRGVPAERVAASAVKQAESYLAAGVPVGRYLADQLLLPLALAGGGAFRTLPLSRHARTNIAVIQKFLDIEIHVADLGGGCREIRVG